MYKQKPPLLFLFTTLLIDFIGFGLIIPIMPKLIQEVSGRGLDYAAQIGGFLGLCFSLMQFIFAPILGGLSDRYGRRPIILLSLLGLGIDYILLALAPSLLFLFIGRCFAGITSASYATAQAYISDVTPPEKRVQKFGLVEAALGLGVIIGPLIGGFFGQFGTRIPFFIAAGLSLTNVVVGLIVLPESLSMKNRRRFEWKRSNPLGYIIKLNKYSFLKPILITLFLIFLASHSIQSIWSYYSIEKFSWSESSIGYSLVFFGLFMCLVQSFCIKPIVYRFGEKKAIFLGLLLYIISYFLLGFSFNSWIFLLSIIPYCIAGISGPAMQSIVMSKIPQNEYGEVQGILSGVSSLAAIFGPWIMTQIFSFFISKNSIINFAGAPFIFSMVLIFIALVLIRNFIRNE